MFSELAHQIICSLFRASFIHYNVYYVVPITDCFSHAYYVCCGVTDCVNFLMCIMYVVHY